MIRTTSSRAVLLFSAMILSCGGGTGTTSGGGGTIAQREGQDRAGRFLVEVEARRRGRGATAARPTAEPVLQARVAAAERQAVPARPAIRCPRDCSMRIAPPTGIPESCPTISFIFPSAVTGFRFAPRFAPAPSPGPISTRP